MMQAANYSARKTVVDGVDVVQLADAASHLEVSIAVSIGNMAYEMNVGGKNVFWSPYHSPAELKAKPTFCGIPFLAPWANRIETDAYWLNGKKYLLNFDLGNVRRDQNQNAHPRASQLFAGLDPGLGRCRRRSARATSRLDFWKHPELMAQFPFAHTITMTYRLANGALEVETTLRESLRRAHARGHRLSPLLPASTTRRAINGGCTWPRATTSY